MSAPTPQLQSPGPAPDADALFFDPEAGCR